MNVAKNTLGITIKISVVTTLYNSAEYIQSFYQQTIEAINQLAVDSYELIFVDDGSPDDSLAQAIALTQRDCHVRVLELSRNFGHHRAIMAGLQKASGDYVFFVDSDLEERPALLVDFYQTLVHEQADVVYGVQESRGGSRFNEFSGNLFYRLFNVLTDTPIPRNMLNVRLMTRDYVDSLNQYDEKSIFMAGIWSSVGYKQVPKIVVRHHRESTTYTFRKRLSLMVTGVSSFSNKPLLIVFYLGMFISLGAFGFILYLFYQYYQGVDVPGYLSTIASTWFFGGIMLLCQGILAIYLAKVFEEVKNRPTSIVKKEHAKREEHD